MLSPDPGVSPRLTRRRILVDGGRGLLVLATLGAVTTACGTSAPPATDPLEAQLESALQDSVLATAAAKSAAPTVAPALTVIAQERAQHAAALTEEIARAAGKPLPTTTSPAATTTASTQAATPPTAKDVVSALRASAESATKLVPTLSGYRAGLLGSIAAACTTGYSIALAPNGGQQ